MARLIEFQGKSIATGTWITGSIYFENNLCNQFELECCGRVFIDKLVAKNRTERLQIIPETLGQYTNVIGCNGKRIYERDIVAKGFDRGEVYWNYNFNGWRVAVETEDRLYDAPLDNSFIVVGHKYDELIHSGFYKEIYNDSLDNKRKQKNIPKDIRGCYR